MHTGVAMAGTSLDFDFSNLTEVEWGELDLADLVRRYAEHNIGRLDYRGSNRADAFVEVDDLVNEYFLTAFPRLQSAHRRGLALQGRERNRMIVGVLNSCRHTAFRAKCGTIGPLPSDKGNGSEEEEAEVDPGLSYVDAIVTDRHLQISAEGYCFAAQMTHLEQSTRPPEDLIDDVDRLADEVGLATKLERVRGALTAHQYRVLHARLFGGKSRDEIAASMGVMPQTISSVRAAAQRRLQKLLDNRMITEEPPSAPAREPVAP